MGGAVRDKLLGLKSTDQDWLIFGETPQSLEAKGYKKVGSDFSVFLHPKNNQEYALPRGEKQTLNEDLGLRDISINAMAMDQKGHIIDPFHGQKDLQQRVLRHLDYFEQDPIRVLRICRFVAKLAPFHFKIAPETQLLIKRMGQNGVLNQLTPERVWQEIVKAMATPRPRLFFEALRECGVLKIILPEIEALYGMPQPIQHHPEIDTGLHCMLVLDQICDITTDPRTRFSALCHDLGKATTDFDILPSHFGHELRGADIVSTLCKRLNAPKDWFELSYMVAKYHTDCHQIITHKTTTVIRKFKEMGLFRKPQDLIPFVSCCLADSRGRTGLESKAYPQAEIFTQYFQAASDVITKDLAQFPSQQIPQKLHLRRLKAVRKIKSQLNLN